MKFLKKQSQVTPTTSLTYLLHNHLSGFEEGRPKKLVHASEVTKEGNICPRMYALYDLTKAKPKEEYLTTSLAVTFQMGRDLERNVVNWFADMGKAICHWKCINCGTQHDFCLRPMKCSKCDSNRFEPKEVRFVSALNGISCGVDMLLSLGEGKLRPVEIKTMDKDEFKSLVSPLAEHRLRTNLYLRIMSESKQPSASLVNHKEGTVLYVTKGGFGCAAPHLKKLGINEGFSPFKEFEIARADKDTDALVFPAAVVKGYRDGVIGIPHGVCTTALSPRAKGCPMKAQCFSGKFPPGHDWKVKK